MSYVGPSCQYLSSAKWSAVAAWAATTAFTAGQIVRQNATPAAGNERVFVCIVGGTSLGAEPTWTFNRGDKIVESGGPTWQEATGQAALNGDLVNTYNWTQMKAVASAPSQGYVITDAAGTHIFICSVAGGVGASEPAWNTAAVGNTTTDNTTTWVYLGTSFTKWSAPHARLQNALAANWGDGMVNKFWIGHDHAETQTAAINFTSRGINLPRSVYPNSSYSGPVDWVCVNTAGSVPPTSADLRTTASITVANSFNGISIAGYLRWVYGITFAAGQGGTSANLNLQNDNNADKHFENCAFQIAGGSAGAAWQFGNSSSGKTRLTGCTFKASHTGQGLRIGGLTVIENSGFDITGSVPANLVTGWQAGCRLIIKDCDLSFLSGSNLVTSPANSNTNVDLIDCKLPASFTTTTPVTNDTTCRVSLTRCSSAASQWAMTAMDAGGRVDVVSTATRSSGASDSGASVGWQITAGTACNNGSQYFECPPLAIYNSKINANTTVTLYGIVNAAAVPTNAEFWADVEYLGSSGNPQATRVSSRAADWLATPSSLAVDSASNWGASAPARQNTHAYNLGDMMGLASNPNRLFFCTTAGTSAGSEPAGYASAVDGGSVTDGSATFRAGCRFSITFTLSAPQPQLVGELYATFFAGKPSTTYIVDPYIYVS